MGWRESRRGRGTGTFAEHSWSTSQILARNLAAWSQRRLVFL